MKGTMTEEQQLGAWVRIIERSGNNGELEKNFKKEFGGYEVSGAELFNIKDAAGNTPLHLAVAAEKPNVMLWLIEQGSDPSIANHEGRRYNELLSYDAILASGWGRGATNFETKLISAIDTTKQFSDPQWKEVISLSSAAYCDEFSHKKRDKDKIEIRIIGRIGDDILPERISVAAPILKTFIQMFNGSEYPDRKSTLNAIHTYLGKEVAKAGRDDKTGIDPVAADILYAAAKSISLGKMLKSARDVEELPVGGRSESTKKGTKRQDSQSSYRDDSDPEESRRKRPRAGTESDSSVQYSSDDSDISLPSINSRKNSARPRTASPGSTTSSAKSTDGESWEKTVGRGSSSTGGPGL